MQHASSCGEAVLGHATRTTCAPTALADLCLAFKGLAHCASENRRCWRPRFRFTRHFLRGRPPTLAGCDHPRLPMRRRKVSGDRYGVAAGMIDDSMR